jgi:hypothetical protein
MPPKCKLRTGQNAGIGPTGCTYQTDSNGTALRGRTAAATGGVADTVTVAKQRPVAGQVKVFRRVRMTYQGKSHTFNAQLYTLDTGAATEALTTRAHFDKVLPPQANYASKWARFTATTTLPTVQIRGVVAGAQGLAYQADVKLEVEVNIGPKNSNQMEFRGGPARIKIVDGGRSYLVGAPFLRRHKIVTK